MTVLSEEKLCTYLSRVLKMSEQTLDNLQVRGTDKVDEATLDRFHALVNDLNTERENDSYLNDDSWNWIFESKAEYNYIQLYGRLSKPLGSTFNRNL